MQTARTPTRPARPIRPAVADARVRAFVWLARQLAWERQVEYLRTHPRGCVHHQAN